MTPRRWLLALAAVALLAACGGGGGGSADAAPAPAPATDPAAIALLFMGNSHTASNDLPQTVAKFVRAARPGQAVTATVAPASLFLDEHASNGTTLALLHGRTWSAVVMQAQKYSTSGAFVYPIEGAVFLVGEARKAQGLPILFPEWPLRGVDETQRIYDVHVSIARRAPACVAPVGQAWDLALQRNPALELYAADGNHSAPAGALLAAMVLASTFSQALPESFPFLPEVGVDASTQSLLRAAATDAVRATSPRRWCPEDR